MSSDQARAIQHWLAVEMLTPQKVPAHNPNDSEFPVFAVVPGRLPPWAPSHAFSRRALPRDKTRRFELYCGTYAHAALISELERVFGRDMEGYDEPRDGSGCLFGIVLNSERKPMFDTFTLSSSAWALSRIKRDGGITAETLAGFERDAAELLAEFREHVGATESPIGPALADEQLWWFIEHVRKRLGANWIDAGPQIIVKASIVSARFADEAGDNDFLNSFFVQDLGRVRTAATSGRLGDGLRAYLQPDAQIDASKRCDTRKQFSQVFKLLAPERFPAGRWPHDPAQPLVFSQQLAVNAALAELLVKSGLFAINGPPGTGKTTILRDLIAAVVVERALALAALSSPEQAFGSECRLKVGKYTHTLKSWSPSFQGFGIVVASSNNSAVENVTLNVPTLNAVDRATFPQASYYSELASAVVGEEAWGLAAAVLGNMRNRREFASRFWYGDDRPNRPSVKGFEKILEALEHQPVDWKGAVLRFKTAVAAERAQFQRAQEVYRKYLKRSKLVSQIQAETRALEAATAELQTTQAQTATARAAVPVAEEHVRNADDERLQHRRFRPGLIEIVLSLGAKFREWNTEDKSLREYQAAARKELQHLRGRVQALEEQRAALDGRIAAAKANLGRLQAQLDDAVQAIESCAQWLGEHLPRYDSWPRAHDARELSSPWGYPKWNEARSALFLEALALHQAFIAANAAVIRKNLQAFINMLRNGARDDVDATALTAAWDTLFFVIPTVSTTFASIGRLFGPLGQEAIGWLLIDEAGQGTPQSAVGAIWRSRRTLVVGDPLQLEPIVTLPVSAQRALLRAYGLEDEWMTSRYSVQERADRTNAIGTLIERGAENIWVGAPLRVHRRCDRLMFDISNRIAYGGQMVFGTGPRPELPLRESAWIHVPATSADGHWIPAEGVAAERLIEELTAAGLDPGQIFIITPFRSVASRLAAIKRRYGVKGGTIHTAQGRESEVVILILGGDPARPGAKQWAAEKPNLLNVAASRAKRRLYVIGNRDLWANLEHFSVCATILPISAPASSRIERAAGG